MLKSSNYGKARVRLVKVERYPDRHDFKELKVNIQFSGDYDDCYLTGDNSRILPTDTMKNTVYALARKQPLGSIEEFGKRLCRHFLEKNPRLKSVTIEIEENQWSRIDGHTFQKRGGLLRTAWIRDGRFVDAGLKDLTLLKTTDSSFEGYIKDEYTTLKETSDRIMATAVEAAWRYSRTDIDFNSTWSGIRQCLTDAFAAHVSPSVQSTLYSMGEAVLAAFPVVEEISLSLPNKHCLLVDLTPFGMDNPNEVFLPVDEPQGLIEATLRR
jgi:urate oxidase